MVYKVLLIGNGAREHAIAKQIVKDGSKLYSYMSYENPGIAKLSSKFILGDLEEFDKLKKFKNVDYAVIGPEKPLAVGMTDYLIDELEIPTSNPRQEVAKLETSKSFARSILHAYDIGGNPDFTICKKFDDFENAIQNQGIQVAIKPDGLTGGKGVKVYGDHFKTRTELEKYAKALFSRNEFFIIENKLEGKEFSLQVFSDGNRIYPMPLVRDYKRAYDGNRGPNTGSMGSYSLPDHSLSFLEQSDINKALSILDKTVQAINKHTGIKYRGVLYGQFIKTDYGLSLIEFNVRFGDPEAMNVLKLLKTNYNEINLSMIDGKMKKPHFDNNATVCTYLVPNGYPIKPKPTYISFRDDILCDLYFASVFHEKNKLKTTSSRAIALLKEAKTIEYAREKIFDDIKKIDGNLFWRTDIGKLS